MSRTSAVASKRRVGSTGDTTGYRFTITPICKYPPRAQYIYAPSARMAGVSTLSFFFYFPLRGHFPSPSTFFFFRSERRRTATVLHKALRALQLAAATPCTCRSRAMGCD